MKRLVRQIVCRVLKFKKKIRKKPFFFSIIHIVYNKCAQSRERDFNKVFNSLRAIYNFLSIVWLSINLDRSIDPRSSSIPLFPACMWRESEKMYRFGRGCIFLLFSMEIVRITKPIKRPPCWQALINISEQDAEPGVWRAPKLPDSGGP